MARGRPGLPIGSSHRQEAGRRWSYDQLDLHRARRLPEQLRGEAAWQWWRGRCRAEGGRLHHQGDGGFDSLFLLVDGLSIVDIITLFTSAALGLVASCTDAWPLRSSSSCSTATSWRLRRLMGHGRWTNGRFCQGCTGIGSVCALVPDVWSGLDTFRYI